MKTFEIVKGRTQNGIKCLICGLTSWNRNDVEKEYCGNCHQFHEVMSAGVEKVGEFIEKGRGPR